MNTQMTAPIYTADLSAAAMKDSPLIIALDLETAVEARGTGEHPWRCRRLL